MEKALRLVAQYSSWTGVCDGLAWFTLCRITPLQTWEPGAITINDFYDNFSPYLPDVGDIIELNGWNARTTVTSGSARIYGLLSRASGTTLTLRQRTLNFSTSNTTGSLLTITDGTSTGFSADQTFSWREIE